MKLHTLIALVALVALGGAVAAGPLQASNTLDPDDARVLLAEVRADLAPGGRYAHLSDGEKRAVEAHLAAIEHQLERYGDVDTMPVRIRVRMYNRQEQVNQILAGLHVADVESCDREHRTGTRIGATLCGSEAERKQRREEDQARLRSMQRAAMPSGR